MCHFLVIIGQFVHFRFFSGFECLLDEGLFLHVGVHRLVELMLEVGRKLVLVGIDGLVVIAFPILHLLIVLLLEHIRLILMICFTFKKLYFINYK